MTKESHTLPLLEDLITRSRLPWRWITVIVAVVLLLLIILMTYLDGAFSNLADWEFWRRFLGPPVIITYILLIYPFMQRLEERAVQAFQTLLPPEEDEKTPIITAPNRRWEWTAVFLGVIFWLGLERPWLWIDQWLDVYASVTTLLMFVLLGWLIYNGISGTRRLNMLSRRHLNIDIFNTGLVPIARYSMGITFAFIGGISLSLVFQSIESLLEWQSITIYSILVCVTVLLFFLSMWSTHNVMLGAKKRELAIVETQLEEATRELRETVGQDRAEGIDRLYSAVAAWGIYERRVQEAPEWPYNASILRRFSISVLIPGIVYLIKILFNIGIGL